MRVRKSLRLQYSNCLIVILALISLQLISVGRLVGQEKSPRWMKKSIPMAAGQVWTYRVKVPDTVVMIYDPIVLAPSGLMGSSSTHRLVGRGPEETTFTVTTLGGAGDSAARVDVGDVGKSLWFPHKTREVKLAIVPFRGVPGLFSLEVQGTMEEPDGWVLACRLAALPAAEGSKTDDGDFLAEPFAEPVKVPAGEFAKGFHSLLKVTPKMYVPPYSLESWTADGVGLVKAVMRDSNGKVIYALELVNYQGK